MLAYGDRRSGGAREPGPCLPVRPRRGADHRDPRHLAGDAPRRCSVAAGPPARSGGRAAPFRAPPRSYALRDGGDLLRQELTEGAVAAGHPAGLAAVLANGGWIALPLAVAAGAVCAWSAWLLQGVERTLARGAPSRPARARPVALAEPHAAPARVPACVAEPGLRLRAATAAAPSSRLTRRGRPPAANRCAARPRGKEHECNPEELSLGLAAGGVALAVVLFIVLSEGDESDSDSTTTAGRTATTTTAGPRRRPPPSRSRRKSSSATAPPWAGCRRSRSPRGTPFAST